MLEHATEPEFEKLKAEGRIWFGLKVELGQAEGHQYTSRRSKGLVPWTLVAMRSRSAHTESNPRSTCLTFFTDYDESDLRIHAPKPVSIWSDA